VKKKEDTAQDGCRPTAPSPAFAGNPASGPRHPCRGCPSVFNIVTDKSQFRPGERAGPAVPARVDPQHRHLPRTSMPARRRTTERILFYSAPSTRSARCTRARP
jgi:hypothetical protein